MSVGSVERLTVKCPSCGKTGKLPLGVTTYPKNVKCTGCQTKFNPGAAALEKVALDAVCIKEPEVYDFERPVFQPVNQAPPNLAQIPVRQDPPISPPPVDLGISTSRPARKLKVSVAVLLLLMVPLTIGATVLTMRFLSTSGTTLPSFRGLKSAVVNQLSDPKAEAEAFLASELDKWMANQKSWAKTIEYMFNAPPVGYQIKNIRESAPFTTSTGSHLNMDELSGEKGDKVVATYEANVDVEFESKAHTPLHQVVRYRMVKFSPSGKWLMAEGRGPITHPR
jgi:hypothetical protein